MNRIFKVALILPFCLLFAACPGTDTPTPVPVREFATQYATDIATIEDYLNTYHIAGIVNHPGLSDDQDITLTKIPVGGSQPSLLSLLNSATFPKLLKHEVSLHDITYTVYYLKLRADNDASGKSPCRVDEVLAAYSGSFLEYIATTTAGVTVTELTETPFESVVFPQQRLALDYTIRGWSEIFPLFKTGDYDATPSPNPASYTNFGAGVMFIPSGLAYYNLGAGTIPSYSPLIFSFKLFDLKRADQDGDGILSIDEDVNHDGDFTNDDTDGDGKQNYLDFDDDGDGYLTRNEIKIDGVVPTLYSLIQDCSGTTTGTKKHLDKTCH